MILHEFPDIGWLKSQIAQGFSNRLGWGNLPLDTEGFPSVIILLQPVASAGCCLQRLVRSILTSNQETGHNKLRFEEGMTALLSYHLRQHRSVAKMVNNMLLVRRATRVELYKRLSRAMDLLRSGFCGEISLDQLATEASLSKYHFLRLFRTAYGLSPYQYIQYLRIEKATLLLTHSAISISDLSRLLGFDNSQSFSRLFYQRMGLYPTQYRLLSK